MSKVLLIGNSGLIHHGNDGQTIKVRLYLRKIRDEGFDVSFVDLENFKKHPIVKLLKIKKEIKVCDRIVLISAERGCRFLIPFINKANKKFNKPFVLPLIGTSVLHYSLDKLTNEQKTDFIVNRNYSYAKAGRKLSEELRKITYILPETQLLTEIFKSFYKLDNVYELTNFREDIDTKVNYEQNEPLKMVFLSRVMEEKGIFDILDIVKSLNDNKKRVVLNIYGKKYLDKQQNDLFNSYLENTNIHYLGSVDSGSVSEALLNNDIFIFPTHFVGEGTPGVIVESLIAGVPVLTADFPQAKYLLEDGKDSIFYKMFDNEDLKKKIMYIINNKEILGKLRKNAKISGEKYIYSHERKKFLKYVCGIEED